MASRSGSGRSRWRQRFPLHVKYTSTNSGDTCAAGLRISLGGGVCDVHPTPKGRDVLAGAVLEAIEAEGDN